MYLTGAFECPDHKNHGCDYGAGKAFCGDDRWKWTCLQVPSWRCRTQRGYSSPPHPSPTNEMLTLPILVGGSGINVSDLCHSPVSFRQSIEIDSAAALPQVRETNSESMMQCAEEVEQSCWQKSKKGIGCQAWCKSIFVLGMNALIQNN